MKKISELLGDIPNIFPGLVLWLRFPGLICWAAVSTGIIGAKFIPVEIIAKQTTVSQFYTIRIISAIITFSAACFFSSRMVRFTLFLFLAIICCALQRAEQHCINTFLLKQQTGYLNHKITGNIISQPAVFKYGYRFLLRCNHASFDSSGMLNGKVIQCTGMISPVSCSKVEVFGRCFAPSRAQKPWEFDESHQLLSKGIHAKMDVDSVKIVSPPSTISIISQHFRETVLTVLDRLHNPAHRGILQAAFLGENDNLNSETKVLFRKSGIYHLLSISGLHASMLIAATYFFLTLLPVGHNFKHITALSVLWIYQFFIGFIPSLFRATIMTTLIIGSFLYQKKNYSLQSIGLAGTLWLLYSPESLFQPGFQLSFSATIGIITLVPVLNRLFPRVPSAAGDFIVSRIVSTLNISLSSFLSTLPVLLFHFGSISFFGLAANLAAVSVMTLCMWSFFISLFFESLIPCISSIGMDISALMLDLLIWIARQADLIPWAAVTMDVPYPEILSVYLLLLTGFVSINKKYTLNFLKWSVPVFILLIPAISLLKTHYDEILIERFNTRGNNTLAVCWPYRGVWIMSDCSTKDLKKLYNYSISSWMRHRRDVYLERVFIFNKSLPQKLIEISPALLYESTAIPSKMSLFKNAAKSSSTLCLYSYLKVDSENIAFRIETKNRWISFNFADSVIYSGLQNQMQPQVSVFPSTFKIYDQ